MADRYYRNSPRAQNEVYMPMPVDRKELGEKKIENLQKQIAKMENDQIQRKHLIEKLARLEEAQGIKQQKQDHVIERYSKKHLLNGEVDRLFGKEEEPKTSKKSGKTIENVLAHRTKEFALKQQEKELETKYLMKERERLQAARDRIREQRRAMLTPAGKTKPINKHQIDVISFLKGLGLYHRVPTPPLTPLPWLRKRKGRRKIRYYPCPLRWSHW